LRSSRVWFCAPLARDEFLAISCNAFDTRDMTAPHLPTYLLFLLWQFACCDGACASDNSSHYLVRMNVRQTRLPVSRTGRGAGISPHFACRITARTPHHELTLWNIWRTRGGRRQRGRASISGCMTRSNEAADRAVRLPSPPSHCSFSLPPCANSSAHANVCHALTRLLTPMTIRHTILLPRSLPAHHFAHTTTCCCLPLRCLRPPSAARRLTYNRNHSPTSPIPIHHKRRPLLKRLPRSADAAPLVGSFTLQHHAALPFAELRCHHHGMTFSLQHALFRYLIRGGVDGATRARARITRTDVNNGPVAVFLDAATRAAFKAAGGRRVGAPLVVPVRRCGHRRNAAYTARHTKPFLAELDILPILLTRLYYPSLRSAYSILSLSAISS